MTVDNRSTTTKVDRYWYLITANGDFIILTNERSAQLALCTYKGSMVFTGDTIEQFLDHRARSNRLRNGGKYDE